jgi:hypothetical protein
MARKTFSVQDLRNQINASLQSDKLSQDAKAALCVHLEKVLRQTGNYGGYTYNDAANFFSAADPRNDFLYSDNWKENYEFNRTYLTK